jgi:hypothetical protein
VSRPLQLFLAQMTSQPGPGAIPHGQRIGHQRAPRGSQGKALAGPTSAAILAHQRAQLQNLNITTERGCVDAGTGRELRQCWLVATPDSNQKAELLGCQAGWLKAGVEVPREGAASPTWKRSARLTRR